MRFPIVIHKEEGACYGVTVPDLLGCISAGDTLDEVFGPSGVQEAILLHVEGILEDGGAVPERKSIEEHMSGEFSEDYEGGIWAFVDVDLAPLMPDVAKRISVTIPSQVLAQIDHQAREERETRSGFLAKAALEHIAAASGAS